MSASKILLIFALVGFGALASIFVFYISVFGISVSHCHNTWAEFGSFFGGAAGPIFGLLSLLALLYTIHIQLVELRRSSKAQEEAANYSRLNALVVLCNHYREEIPKMEECANKLAGLPDGISSGRECIQTRKLLHEVEREIEKYHSALMNKNG